MQLAALYRKLFGPKPQPDPFAGVRSARPATLPPAPTKHHHFHLHARNQWTGRTIYRCRCGAWYTCDMRGWMASEGDSIYGRPCKKVKP